MLEQNGKTRCVDKCCDVTLWAFAKTGTNRAKPKPLLTSSYARRKKGLSSHSESVQDHSVIYALDHV